MIRGLFKNVKAFQWTPEYLADHFGSRQFYISSNNRIGESAGLHRNMQGQWATVPTVVANITKGGNNYLFNANLDYPADVPIFDDIQLNERVGNELKACIVQFFLGRTRPGETRLGGSPLHAAAAPNINVQLKGRKKWILIDPKYTRWTNPYLLSKQLATLAKRDDPAGFRWTNMPRFEGILEPGDAIMIPPWYHHEVHNLPGDEWIMSVAIRFPNLAASWRNNWHFTAMVDLGTVDRPCLPGLRLVCMQFHPGWKGGYQLQNQSVGGLEGHPIWNKFKAKIEEEGRDLE